MARGGEGMRRRRGVDNPGLRGIGEPEKHVDKRQGFFIEEYIKTSTLKSLKALSLVCCAGSQGEKGERRST